MGDENRPQFVPGSLELVLEVDAMVRVRDGSSLLVRLAYGRLWITERGIWNDIVLTAGMWLQLRKEGIAVM